MPWPTRPERRSTAPERARLFVESPLSETARLELPAAAARHVQVLRLQPGDAIVLFNGAGEAPLEWPATILRIGRREVEVQLGPARRVERELAWPVTLALAPTTNDRMDSLVEKAGELGAAAIQPLLSERSVLRLSGARAEARRRHWQGIAAAASEQCGRVRVTHIEAVETLPTWLPGAAAPLCKLLLSLDADAIAPALSMLPPPATPIVILSGPEGGLSAAEQHLAVERGFVRLGLGPRVLRGDTAPLAVLAWLGLVRP